MPAPSTTAEFLELVRKSGLLEAERLDPALETITSRARPETARQLAAAMVKGGLLTQFDNRFLDDQAPDVFP